jgi:hypothetical protein
MAHSLRLAVFLSLLLSVTPWAHAASPCDACAGKPLEPVHISIESLEMAEHWVHEANTQNERDSLHKQHCPGCRTISYIGTEPSSIANALEQAASHCQSVKLLSISTHGRAGQLSFKSFAGRHENFSALDVARLSPALSCAMAPDAHIESSGCSVADGCRGEDFMALLARRLLSKGGSIEACATSVFTTPFTSTICTSRRVLTVAPGATLSSWKVPGIYIGMSRNPARLKSHEDCSDAVHDEYAEVVEAASRKYCRLKPSEKVLLSSVIALFGRAWRYEETHSGNRDFLDGARYSAAIQWDLASQNAGWLRSVMEKRPKCPTTTSWLEMTGALDKPQGSTPESKASVEREPARKDAALAQRTGEQPGDLSSRAAQ